MRERAAEALKHHRRRTCIALRRHRRDRPGAAGRRARRPRRRRRRRSGERSLRHLDELAGCKPDKLVRRRAREVPAHGAVRGVSRRRAAADRGRFKGNRKDFFTVGRSPSRRALEAPVIVEADRGDDLGRVYAAGELGGQAQRRRARTDAAAPAADAPGAARRRRSRRRSPRRDELRAPGRRRPAQGAQRRCKRARPRDEGLRRRVAVGPQEAHDLLHGREAGGLPQLVRELASTFRTRIELQQIGVRDEAKRLDGIGRCGRQYCCVAGCPSCGRSTCSVAKDQRLSLNPSQISGACGRLMCCLRYEHEFYVQSRKRFPKEGQGASRRRRAKRRSWPSTSSANG